MSNSLLIHGLQPARLLCPWGSPGKTTGVRCHFLHQGIFPIKRLNLVSMSPTLTGRFFNGGANWEALLSMDVTILDISFKWPCNYFKPFLTTGFYTKIISIKSKESHCTKSNWHHFIILHRRKNMLFYIQGEIGKCNYYKNKIASSKT